MSTTDCLYCHKVANNTTSLKQLSSRYDATLYTQQNSMIFAVRIFLVLILRVGFILVQIGSVPITNVNLILLHNVVDFCWVTLVYFLTGCVIAFTGDNSGLVGGGYWIADEMADKEEIMYGWQVIAIASAVHTTLIAGRMHTVGTLVLGGVLSGIVQPFVIHWTRTTYGWMAHNYIYATDVFYHDYGGAATVHVVGGVTGLIGCLVLGRRLLRLQEIDDASISVGSVGSTVAGHFFIVLGLQTLLIPPDANTNTLVSRLTSLLPINNLLAISTSGLMVIVLHFAMREPFNHWTVMRCIEGITAGVVVVSAGADVFTPAVSMALGCGGGVLFYLFAKTLFQSALEDYCNVVATHIICAMFGIVVAPIFYTTQAFHTANSVLMNILWQAICLVSVIGFTILVMAPAFVIVEWCGLLRNRSEYVNHLRSNAVLERGPNRPFLKRLFHVNGETVLMQPGVAGQDIEINDGANNRRTVEPVSQQT